MRRTKRIQQNKRSHWLLPLLAIILLFGISCLIIGNLKTRQQRKTLNSRLEALNETLGELSQERTFLQSDISQSQLPDYLEKVAREELNLKKEGENVVAFPISEESPVAETATSQEDTWQNSNNTSE